jgi:hypothetical protein
MACCPPPTLPPAGLPERRRIAHKGIWVEPELLTEIEYRAKSAEGKVRHPFFKGRSAILQGGDGWCAGGIPILEAALSYVLEKMASNGRRQTRNRISLSLSH